MGANSFQIKGLAVTLASACIALYANQPRWAYLIMGLALVIAFWFLDTYYLMMERRFRGLYYDVVNDNEIPPFSMDTDGYTSKKNPKYSPCRVFWSKTISWLYGIIALVFVVWLIALALSNLSCNNCNC